MGNLYFSLVHIIHLFAQLRPMAFLALVRSVALLRAFFARISVQKFQRKMRGMNTLPDACSWACGHLIQTCRKKNSRGPIAGRHTANEMSKAIHVYTIYAEGYNENAFKTFRLPSLVDHK